MLKLKERCPVLLILGEKKGTVEKRIIDELLTCLTDRYDELVFDFRYSYGKQFAVKLANMRKLDMGIAITTMTRVVGRNYVFSGG
jgi:hypothetical protein